MLLIEVAFKGNRKEFYSWEGAEPPPLRASIVVEADRGEDLGVVHATGELAQKRCGGCSHGLGSSEPTRKALRVASQREVRQAREVRAQDESARQKAAARAKAHGLVMKVSDAEWQWDRKKLTFYFTADRRVDFRDLVRDLAALFRARIELKQIGVRDEAKRLDGVGRCGRQFCSASWLPELRPVNLGVAKDQRLSLNPSQISGACGRLMCCLRYEHELYVESRKRFPKEGKTLVTARGEEKVVSNEIFNERVTLRAADGEARVIPLAQLRRELAAAGQSLPGGEPAAPDGGDPALSVSDVVETEGSVEIEATGLFGAVETFDADLPGDGERPHETRDEWEGVPPTPRASAGAPHASRAPVGSGPSRGDRTPRPRTRSSRSGEHRQGAATGSGAAPRPDSPALPAAPQASQPPDPPAAARDEAPAGESAVGPRRRRGRRGGRRGRGKGAGPGALSSGPDGESTSADGGHPDRPSDASNGAGEPRGTGPAPPSGAL